MPGRKLLFLALAAAWRLTETRGCRALVDQIVQHTHTCYLGERGTLHAWDRGCGQCPACAPRSEVAVQEEAIFLQITFALRKMVLHGRGLRLPCQGLDVLDLFRNADALQRFVAVWRRSGLKVRAWGRRHARDVLMT